MTPEQCADKWEEICYVLSKSASQNINEKEFEYHVGKAVETLGWKEFKSEIERQHVLKIGRDRKLIVDLIIYDEKKKPLIAVEVKRPVEDLTRDEVSGQLHSYMLQLKTRFGLVIGKTIRFFYDGPPFQQHSEPVLPELVLLDEIKLERGSKKGLEFVSNINKDSLIDENYTQYLDKLINQVKAKRNIDILRQILVSKDTKEKIVSFLRNEYIERFGSEIIENALEFLDIQLSITNPVIGSGKGQTFPTNKFSTSPPPDTIRGKILHLIQSCQNGIGPNQISKKLNFSSKQVSNALAYLKKREKIKSIGLGAWVATQSETPVKRPTVPVITPTGSKTKIDIVFDIIERSLVGASFAEIKEKTDLDVKQLNNIIYKLKERELIESISKGHYAVKGTIKPISTKNTPKTEINGELTATDQVLGIINGSKDGVNIYALMEKTSFKRKKVTNILQRTFKQGKIKRVEKGVYVEA